MFLCGLKEINEKTMFNIYINEFRVMKHNPARFKSNIEHFECQRELVILMAFIIMDISHTDLRVYNQNNT